MVPTLSTQLISSSGDLDTVTNVDDPDELTTGDPDEHTVGDPDEHTVGDRGIPTASDPGTVTIADHGDVTGYDPDRPSAVEMHRPTTGEPDERGTGYMDEVTVGNGMYVTGRVIDTTPQNLTDMYDGTTQLAVTEAPSSPCLYNYTQYQVIYDDYIYEETNCATCRLYVSMSFNGRLGTPVCSVNLCSKHHCKTNTMSGNCDCAQNCSAMGVCCANHHTTCGPIQNDAHPSNGNDVDASSVQTTEPPILRGSTREYSEQVKRCAKSPTTKHFPRDIPTSMSSEISLADQAPSLLHYVKCVEISGPDDHRKSYFMIADCPADLTPDLLSYKHKCMHPHAIINDPNDYVFANSLVLIESRLFRNIFCAKCHNISITNPRYIKPIFHCAQENDDALWETLGTNFEKTFKFLITNCSLYYKTQYQNYRCPDVYSYTTHCNASLRDALVDYDYVENTCMQYRSDVALISSIKAHTNLYESIIVYKNAHCALCNGISDMTELACTPFSLLKQRMLDPTYRMRSFFMILDMSKTTSAVQLRHGSYTICPGGMLETSTGKCIASTCVGKSPHRLNCSLLPQESAPILNKTTIYEGKSAVISICIADSFEQTHLSSIRPFTFFLHDICLQNTHNSIQLPSSWSYVYNASDCITYICHSKDVNLMTKIMLDETQFASKVELYVAQYHLTSLSIILSNYLDDLGDRAPLAMPSCERDAQLVSLSNISVLSSRERNRVDMYYVGTEYPRVHHSRSRSMLRYSFQGSSYPDNVFEFHTDLSVQSCIPDVLMCDTVTLAPDTFLLDEYVLTYLSVKVQLKGRGSVYMERGSLVTCRDYIPSIQVNPNDREEKIHRILSLICLTASSIGLWCTLLIHIVVPKLRKSVPGQCLMNYSTALMIAQILLLISGVMQQWPLACVIIGVVQHFFWLASFLWSCVIATDVYLVFGRTDGRPVYTVGTRKMVAYYMVGWMLPSVFVCTCVVLNVYTGLRVGYGDGGSCWITTTDGMIAAFFAPLLAITLLNTILVVSALVMITRTMNFSQAMNVGSAGREKLTIYMRLISIIGLTWLFGLLANITGIRYMAYPFILLNGSQGVFVCLSFCTSQKVRQELTSYLHSYAGT